MKERVEHIAVTRPRGSALILTVVLTSLLAIVGVLFVMAVRIDKMATTATTENRELACAIDTVLTQINQSLVDDIPGVGSDQENYDYPDERNPWLADLEPYESGGNYYWRQISSLDGMPTTNSRDVRIRLVGERDPIDPNLGAGSALTTADADGDGVADSRWFVVPGVMTSKGKPFYAAVRIVDNSAMLNMNTGFKFNPSDPCEGNVDGSSPLHVNILALAAGPGSAPTSADEAALLGARANRDADPAATVDLHRYEQDVIWQYLDVKNPSLSDPSPYTPFDISDEMELRYRYLLNQRDMTSRVEDCGRFKKNTIWTPVDGPNESDALGSWFRRAAAGGADDTYAYRHVATTYNMDRILTPKPLELDDGTKLRKMVNVNTADEATLRPAIRAALFETDPNADAAVVDQKAAQITANLLDYIDDDDEVTVISGGLSSAYYGFEQPCIYISEIACRQKRDDSTGVVHSSYAIELHRPYFEDKDPAAGEWKLQIRNSSSATDTNVDLPLTWTGSRRFHVVLAEDSEAPLSKDYIVFTDAEEPTDTMPRFGYNPGDYAGQPQDAGADGFKFGADSSITLWRSVPAAGKWIIVDSVRVPDGWIKVDDVARSLQRDISTHKCVRRLWAPPEQYSTPSLGNAVGNYVDTERPEIIQAHPANRPLKNIGELGMIFRENVYNLQEGATASGVLVDLGDLVYSRLFNYLTVIDPAEHQPSGATDAETRIMGRININTAPAFVLAQLPWIRYEETEEFKRARDIVARRVVNGRSNPYRSIGELMQITSMRDLAFDTRDNLHSEDGPDLTPDTARDDFEERDLLFTRISDLVTVRSDVFTAYVLVRIGTAGPQKRLIAVFDRSHVNAAGGRARLIARHPMPDPR